MAGREFGRQRVGIRDVQVGVPAGDALFDVPVWFGTGSTPIAFMMIIAASRGTMPKKRSSSLGPWNVTATPSRSR